jgi:hypothetical protein
MKVMQEANPQRVPDFHKNIIWKAEGVFLWVRLVVKSLIDGLRNGDELSVLQQRVDELPADLEKLYRHILQRIPGRYQIGSARLFSIMAATEKAPHSLLLWYAGERGYNPLEPEASDTMRVARCYQVHLRLMSQCAGLLELRMSTGSKPSVVTEDDPDLTLPDEGWSFSTRQHYIYSTVHYLHRTTRDFLHRPDIGQLMQERLAGTSFDCFSWLAIQAFIALCQVQMRIARIKELGDHDDWEMFGFELQEKENYFQRCFNKCTTEKVRIKLDHLVQCLDVATGEPDSDFEALSAVLKQILGLIDSI